MAAYTTIDDSEAYFQIALYTGNASNRDITLEGETDMQPDLVWIKERSGGPESGVEGHKIFDSVRGATNLIQSSSTGLEQDQDTSLTAFNSDGFSLGTDSGDIVNENTVLHVAWCWKAGTTSGKSTTNETITPSGYSVNTTSKFGIYAYTGTGSAGYINHGLGATPGMIIIKERNNTSGWYLWHKNLTATTGYMMVLNTTAGVGTTSSGTAGPLANTAPTSTLYRLGTDSDANNSSDTYVNYVFADVQGFSKFGSYTGNGNADGPFVYTGFRPAFLIAKRTDATNSWHMWDNKRDGYNPSNEDLRANMDAAEGEGNVAVDLLSNGFKWLSSDGAQNASGGTYIYIAFAEAPFVNSEGVPNNAR